jgi:hypothetical protein
LIGGDPCHGCLVSFTITKHHTIIENAFKQLATRILALIGEIAQNDARILTHVRSKGYQFQNDVLCSRTAWPGAIWRDRE